MLFLIMARKVVRSQAVISDRIRSRPKPTLIEILYSALTRLKRTIRSADYEPICKELLVERSLLSRQCIEAFHEGARGKR